MRNKRSNKEEIQEVLNKEGNNTELLQGLMRTPNRKKYLSKLWLVDEGNQDGVMLGSVITGVAIILFFSSEVLKQVPGNIEL